jgi:hypothetical protein
MLPLLGRRLRRLGSRMGRNGVLLLLFSAVIMLGLSGCGTGNGLFTALKTYNVTVTASSAGVQHSTNLTLNVQ